MTEEQPFKDSGEKPTTLPLNAPNVISTLDTPPHPDAVKAHDAAIRKHLRDRKPPEGPAAGA
ncbi:MAG: hypothetical protein JWN10_1501 [Solirubrobacterales bacterium]|jgi:hypothetical protein|nr:hypothetical protein [Solirubrobacterales bacterium]